MVGMQEAQRYQYQYRGRDPHRTPGPVRVKRAYKFRAYPTRSQEVRAGRLLAHGPMDADVNGARNMYARAGLGSGQATRAA